jgi:hypothetical protein
MTVRPGSIPGIMNESQSPEVVPSKCMFQKCQGDSDLSSDSKEEESTRQREGMDQNERKARRRR